MKDIVNYVHSQSVYIYNLYTAPNNKQRVCTMQVTAVYEVCRAWGTTYKWFVTLPVNNLMTTPLPGAHELPKAANCFQWVLRSWYTLPPPPPPTPTTNYEQFVVRITTWTPVSLL